MCVCVCVCLLLLLLLLLLCVCVCVCVCTCVCTNRMIPNDNGINILIKHILSICIPTVMTNTPVIWHSGIKTIGNFAIATNVIQNAKILEKKSLYCKICIKQIYYKSQVFKNLRYKF